MRPERELQSVGLRHPTGAVTVTVSFEPGDIAPTDDAGGAPPPRRGTGVSLLAVAALAVIGFAGWTAVAARQESQADLAAVRAPQAGPATRLAPAARRASDETVMAAYRLSGGAVADVERDMTWIAQNKANPVAMTHLSWTRGRMVVAGPYPTSPFRPGDRLITPVSQPQPPGVQAYAVAPRPPPPAAAGPAAAAGEGR